MNLIGGLVADVTIPSTTLENMLHLLAVYLVTSLLYVVISKYLNKHLFWLLHIDNMQFIVPNS